MKASRARSLADVWHCFPDRGPFISARHRGAPQRLLIRDLLGGAMCFLCICSETLTCWCWKSRRCWRWWALQGAVLRAVFAWRLLSWSSVLYYLSSACWDSFICLLLHVLLYCLRQMQHACVCGKNAPYSCAPLTNPKRSVKPTYRAKKVPGLQPSDMVRWKRE